MKVNKSTQDCAAFNLANAAVIAAGLMDNQEPDDEMLRQEASERTRAQSKEQFAALSGQFWNLVIAQLSADDAKVYEMPQKGAHLSYDSAADKSNSYFKTRGEVNVHTTGYHYERRPGKLRVSIGEFGESKRQVHFNYKPNAIAQMATDVEFAKKCATEITERMMENRRKYQANIDKANYASRKAIVYDANKAFFNSIGNYGDFSLSSDSGEITVSIQVKGNIERLKEIVDFTKQPLTKVS